MARDQAFHSSDLVGAVETLRRRAIQGLFILIVAFILFEALRGAQFWNKVKGEGNLWNYGSSLVYFTAGQLALINAVLLRYRRKLEGQDTRSWGAAAWGVVGIAFAYFACDEMLEIHERLGLAMERSMPWLAKAYPGHADNLITVGYGVGALLFTAIFLRTLAGGRTDKGYLIAGLVMMAVAAALDAVPRELYLSHLPFRETEELLEVFAGFSFVAAFLSTASFLVMRILGTTDNRAPKPSPVEVVSNDSRA